MRVYIENKNDFSDNFIDKLLDIFPGIEIVDDKDGKVDVFIIVNDGDEKHFQEKLVSLCNSHISKFHQHIIVYNKDFRDHIMYNSFGDCTTNDERFIIDILKDYAPQYLQEFVDE